MAIATAALYDPLLLTGRFNLCIYCRVGVAVCHGGSLMTVVRRFGLCRLYIFKTVYSETSILAVGLTQPLIQWGPGVKWCGCEVDHSCQSVAEVNLMAPELFFLF